MPKLESSRLNGVAINANKHKHACVRARGSKITEKAIFISRNFIKKLKIPLLRYSSE